MLPDEWLSRARDALRFAQAGYAASGIPGFTCFLAHQAAELALKGFLTAHGQKPPRIHDLALLMDRCMETAEGFGGSHEDALALNPWYIPGRYPTPSAVRASAQDAEDALAAAERLVLAAGGPAEGVADGA